MKIFRPVFWKDKNILSYILYPVSLIFILIIFLKKMWKQKKFKIKTICIGNIFIGGTGKTSLSIEIYKMINKKIKTTYIKKKYKNQVDEKQLLQKNGNVFFEKHREDALKLAQDKNFKVAILDDGLQQKNIKYDLTIVCFNSKEAIGNEFIIPSGPLREKFNEIKNYDLVFIIGNNPNKKLFNKIKKIKKKSSIFLANYVPTNLSQFNLKKKYLIFSGIGNPHEFENTLIKNKFKIEEKVTFPDHYEYKDKDLKNIRDLAKKKKLDIITTEKDFLRLKKRQKKNIKFLIVKLDISKKSKLKKILLKK